MHVLNLIQCTDLGGMEQASLRVMAGLQARGHTCEVVSTNLVGKLGPALATHGIPVVGVPFRGRAGWRSHFKLRGVVRPRAAAADAVLMTGPTVTGMLCLSPRRRQRQVLAVHYHHTGVKSPRSWRFIYGLALKRFHAVTFPSEFIRNEATALCPGLRAVGHVVHNPLPIPPPPTAEERATARAALGLPGGVPIVGNAGWLIHRKRFDVFLRVATRVRASVRDVLFVIAGDGPERQPLEALAAEIGVAPAVRWLGWQPDLKPFYPALDVLLFNSEWDAFGLTPVEAMSYGVPVVASVRNGGLGEVMTDPKWGTLLRDHDEPALADAVVELLRAREAAQQVGLAGRERVANLLSEGKCVTAVERLLAGAAQ
jgi:glycosyltransferase involved in cell wall biosynthesis